MDRHVPRLNKNNVHDYHQYFCTDDSLGLPDNQITHLLRDSKNRFWVGTVNGVCYTPTRTTSASSPSRPTTRT